MKHAAPRRRGGRHWLLPGIVLAILALLVLVGRLSRSIIADFASWWLVWLILGVGLAYGWRRRVGRLKVAGLMSLLLSVSLLAFGYAHLVGWPVLPSALPNLDGPAVSGIERANISAVLDDGAISVDPSGSGPLYTVGVARGGGPVGAPSASEQQQGADVSIRLAPDTEPGLYTFSGWTIQLATAPTWTLNLGGEVDADLSDLRVANLQLEGSGSVRVGSTGGSAPITVNGDFLISIPADQPVRVIGPAQVPSDWTRTDVGANSPVEGSGWVVSIAEGAVVEIRTH